MAKKIVVSDSLIRKPPPLAELVVDEEYRAELKEWIGGVVSICYKPVTN